MHFPRLIQVQNRTIRFICSSLLLTLILISCGLSPRDEYAQKIKTVYPQYDILNMEIARTLPAPPNTQLLQDEINGQLYGRRLVLYYLTSMTFDEIKAYYTDKMEQAGWTVDEMLASTLFIRETLVYGFLLLINKK